MSNISHMTVLVNNHFLQLTAVLLTT